MKHAIYLVLCVAVTVFVSGCDSNVTQESFLNKLDGEWFFEEQEVTVKFDAQQNTVTCCGHPNPDANSTHPFRVDEFDGKTAKVIVESEESLGDFYLFLDKGEHSSEQLMISFCIGISIICPQYGTEDPNPEDPAWTTSAFVRVD
jgi:hypothetical protein